MYYNLHFLLRKLNNKEAAANCRQQLTFDDDDDLKRKRRNIYDRTRMQQKAAMEKKESDAATTKAKPTAIEIVQGFTRRDFCGVKVRKMCFTIGCAQVLIRYLSD